MQTESVHRPPKYRADIDGLRAVAVMLVVLDHLQFNHFAGGYIGVDVFFVISGYLIGSSMLAEFRAGTFSLAAFYERRIRRIFPALLALLVITSFFAYRYFLPKALLDYAGSLLATLLSISNFFFWRQSGYFDADSVTKPLLHTWSLGVEEQFYLFFPLLLYVIFRWSRSYLRIFLWTTIGITFAIACWVVRINATTAFFWSPLRAWELLVGVIISQYSLVALQARWLRESASALGLAMILYAGLSYSSGTVFPGWTAIMPCLGAALIIAAGQVGTSGAGRVLSIPPIRFLGLISYSLYLWHWPLLVFQNTNHLLIDRPLWLRSVRFSLLGASIVLATLSWWFVETPVRKGRFKPSRRTLYVGSGICAVGFLAFVACALRTNGMPSRFSTDVLWAASFDGYDTVAMWRQGNCFLLPKNSFKDFQPADCLSDVPKQPTYLLYGDSTAAQLYPGLVQIFPEIHFQEATAAACWPYKNSAERFNPTEFSAFGPNCTALAKYVQDVYLPQQRPKAVILAGGWSSVITTDFNALGLEIAEFKKRGISVILVGPVISFDKALPDLVVNEIQLNRSGAQRNADITKHLLPGAMELDTKLETMARDEWRVRYISHFKLLGMKPEITQPIETSVPFVTDTGEPLMFDVHHYTRSGSVLFANRVRASGVLP
jgi:peptidoglycan/LPS O-acetylase OafA/YrhL